MTGEYYQAQLRAILRSIQEVTAYSTEDARRHLRHLQQVRAQTRALKKTVRQEIRLAHAPSAVIRTGTASAAQIANKLLGRDSARLVRLLGKTAATIAPISRGSWELEGVAIEIDNVLLRLDSAIAHCKRRIGVRRPNRPTRAIAL